jgi:arylsulfatase A-like enzyme/tetratricopeptide (TPR) repeat protein
VSTRIVLAAVVSLVAASGCGSGGNRPDVLLVTIDTLRADRLGCYGDPAARTPALDNLAARGARFTQASTVAPITLPSHASILTGRYPAAHGVRNNGTFSLPDAEETLAEVFRREGWRTGGFVGAYVLSRAFGLDQGFETFDDRFDGPGAVEPPAGAVARGARPSERRATAVTDAALAWLRGLGRSEPAFTWVHYFDPHADYAAPEPFLSDFPDRYRGEIAYTDAQIARLLRGLDEAGRLERTLIVVVADHGEAFGEHGETQHGLFVYEPTVRVPFLVAWEEKVPARAVFDDEVSLVDLAPTVASLAGVEFSIALQGRDLSPLLLGGEAPEAGNGVLVENLLPRLEFGWSEMYALRRGGWKLIDAPRPELYDLREDDGETRDLASGRPDEVDAGRRIVRDWVERLERDASEASSGPADADVVDRLQSLGYVGAVAPPGLEDADRDSLPDPKDRVREFLDTKRATGLLAAGRYDEAIALMEKILVADPGNLWMRLEMGRAWQFAGNTSRSDAVFEEVLKRYPDHCEAPYRLGENALVARKDRVEAERWFRQALACDPKRVDALERLSALTLAAGKEPEARSLLERAVALAPSDAALRVRLGDLLDDAGAIEDAATQFRAAIDLDPTAAGAATGLGTFALKRKAYDEATEWFERAVASDPQDAVAWANLGILAFNRGDRRGAVTHLERALELDPSLENARLALEKAR